MVSSANSMITTCSTQAILLRDTKGHYFLFLGGKPVCWVNSLPGAAFTLPVVTGEVLAVAAVLFLRRLLV